MLKFTPHNGYEEQICDFLKIKITRYFKFTVELYIYTKKTCLGECSAYLLISFLPKIQWYWKIRNQWIEQRFGWQNKEISGGGNVKNISTCEVVKQLKNVHTVLITHIWKGIKRIWPRLRIVIGHTGQTEMNTDINEEEPQNYQIEESAMTGYFW